MQLANNAKDTTKVKDACSEPVYVETVGCYAQGYEIDYDVEAKMNHGSVIMETGARTGNLITVQAIFLILPRGTTGRTIALRVFSNTIMLQNSSAIATVLLFAPFETLKRWVLCYEKLGLPLDDHVISNLSVFYSDAYGVSEYWLRQLRKIIETLTEMGLKGISHEGLSSFESYALCPAREMKLIGVQMTEDTHKSYHDDLVNFGNFISQRTHLNVSSSPIWRGFNYLINSGAMKIPNSWSRKVLKHQLFLDAETRLMTYMGFNAKVDEMTQTDMVAYSNALFCVLPDYKGKKLYEKFGHCKICTAIYDNASTGEYTVGNIYRDIIKFIKNFRCHGRDVI